MKRRLALLLVPMVLSILLVGCGKEEVRAKEESAVGKYTDGTYEGIGEGFKGDIKLNVNVESGYITEIQIVEMKESAGIGDVAIEQIIEKIIESQSTEVDTVSGATVSSKGTKEAVEVALGLREAKLQQEEAEIEETVSGGESLEEKLDIGDCQDGSYVGKSQGFHGDIEVKVDIKGGEITNIHIVNIDETQGIGDIAVEKIVEGIISKQSTNVDVVSGATISSKGTINAIEKALEQAK